jgi:hypothetical protein
MPVTASFQQGEATRCKQHPADKCVPSFACHGRPGVVGFTVTVTMVWTFGAVTCSVTQ